MVDKLLKLKAEAEHDLIYAQAKLEIIGKLLADENPTTVEEKVVECDNSDDEELTEV